jgi:DNA-binding CsgD family transcriptional regulator
MEVKPHTRLVVIYGIAMAAGALVLEWLEVQFLLKRFSTEIYVVILCGLFTGLGVWIGHRLTRRAPIKPFEINTMALTYLGISERESDVLTLLAAGHSNQEIADQLFISPNTVKTHLHNLYRRLDVSRRGQAVQKARSLHLVP